MATLTTNAGTAQAVNDGSLLILTGTVSKGDYPVSKVLWTKDSGPDCAFTDAEEWICQIYNLYPGSYVFRFTATDQVGTTGTSTVAVTVTHSNGPLYPNYNNANNDVNLKSSGLPYTLPFRLA